MQEYLVFLRARIYPGFRNSTICIWNTITITSSSNDLFSPIVIDTETVNIKPTSPSYGSTKIELVTIIGTEIKIDLEVSTDKIINNASPEIHGLILGSTELYCVATQTLTFTSNKATMTCYSSTEITCTSCQLSGNPIIISTGDSEDTFGDASIQEKTVQPTSSSLGNIDIKSIIAQKVNGYKTNANIPLFFNL